MALWRRLGLLATGSVAIDGSKFEAVNNRDRNFTAAKMKRRREQISLTDPDARSMATSGRGSGTVGYNVQGAVDTEHHLIVTHEVINVGNDRAQLAAMAKKAKAILEAGELDVVADRGYFDNKEILACKRAGIAVEPT